MPTQYLIKGDLSGIQKFIFNVKSDWAARSIRGRSFFLKIILEVAMRAIFDKLNIKEEDDKEKVKVSTSGGNFVLVLNENPEKVLSEVQAKFVEAFQFIDLNIIFGFTELTNDYAASLEKLDNEIRKKKFQLYESGDFFEPFEHKEIKVNKNERWSDLVADCIINSNIDSWDINEKENNMVLTKNKKSLSFAGYEALFTKGGKYKLENYIENINPRDFTNSNIHKKFEDFVEIEKDIKKDREIKKIICKQLKIDENDEKNINNLVVDINLGIPKLGILAMDVDGLGAYFNTIKSDEEHYKFDKKLRNFFNDRVRDFIEKEDELKDNELTVNFWGKESLKDKKGTIKILKFNNNIYPVTAGGDDSYFVGQWNILLDFAKKINKKFDKIFEGENLTISAAIVIVKPKFPVVRFIELVDDELKKAKYTYPKSKGNISLFGEVIKWEFLEKIETLREEFKNGDGISGGFLAKARLTANNIAESNQGLKLSDYWQMAYYLRKFAEDNKRVFDEIYGTFKKNLDDSNSFSQDMSDESRLKAKNYRLIFPIAARLAELDKRKK